MDYRVKVTGRSQNRTALGIVHAYCRMEPRTTLESLRQAFPNSICPDSGVKELFLPIKEAETFNTKMNLYFSKPEETIVLSDGTVIAMAQVWSKSSLDKITAHAAKYGIEKTEPDKSVGGAGGFSIECLDGYTFPKARKGCLGMLMLPLVVAAGALAYLLS
ncbi:MAG: hypothetical protein K2M11_09450 [Paramuribaculum sp.]|nr:hypothetical protein [Paramuribaculum sp.]